MSQSKSGTIKRRHKAKRSPTPAQGESTAVLKQKVAALEQAVEHLVQTVMHNNELYARAFHMTDGHLWVLKRITEDSAARPKAIKLNADGTIAFAEYYAEFAVYLEKMRAEAQAPKKAEEPVAATTYPVVEFGGDANVTAP